MARPGFIIPNAADATKSSFIAEPDAGDFSVLGHHDYGVYLGCDYVMTGNQFSIVSPLNVFVIKGQVYTKKLDGVTVNIEASSGQSRFDLVGFRLASGIPQLYVVKGAGNTSRPVFPDIPDDMLVLASVYVPDVMGTWAGVQDVLDYVSDKRVFLLSGAKGVAAPTEGFVVATDPTTGQTNFTIRGDGMMLFANGATIKAEGERRITINETLYANNLAGTDLNISRDGNFGGNVNAENIVRGNVAPNDATTNGGVGAIYQDYTNGHLYVKNADGHWELLVPDGYPTGMIVSSILGASFPWLRGMWLLCDGSAVSRQVAANLWTVAPAAWKNETDQTLTLPDLRQRVLMGAQIPGAIGEYGGSNSYVLDQNHLPIHGHDVTISSDGGHHHDVTTNNAGNHTHGLNDPGHVHYPNWYPHPNTQFLSVQWGGRYAIPGRETWWEVARHFWPNPADEPDLGTAIDQNPGTLSATTGVGVIGAGDHGHTASTSDQGHHSHTVVVSKAGAQSVIDNTPQYMTINYFIKN